MLRPVTGFGGLFTLWTALTAPNLFTGYIIVSPSLWYDDHHVLQLVARHEGAAPVGRMYLSVGERETNGQRDMVADLRRLATLLRRPPFDRLEIMSSVQLNKTHNSIFPGALSDGIRYVLEGP